MRSNLYFIVAVGFFLLALLAISFAYYRRIRRSSETSWDDLLAQLNWIDPDKIACVALDVVTESGRPREGEDGFVLEPSAIWDLVGGMGGLTTIEHNCAVLIEMASYVQKQHPEAVVIAEQLRLNAREIEWHVGRLRGAAEVGHLQSSFADYGQRAVVTYYLMTRHVLHLYEQARMPGLPELKRAL